MSFDNFLESCKEHSLELLCNHSLKNLNSFKTGGVAELFFEPHQESELELILKLSHAHNIPVQILGGGSNILVPDNTLAGLCLSTLGLRTSKLEKTRAIFGAGLSVTDAASDLAKAGKRGLDFLYGMPGSVGGAVWMNARCYGREIADVLLSANGYTIDGKKWNYTFNKEDFDYKISPFQKRENNFFVICDCEILLKEDFEAKIWCDMLEHEIDRFSKGHYIAPCAGSVFKNNRNFGAPSGQILDELQWRDTQYNGARVSPFHANIIINDNNARSQDIFLLSKKMQDSVMQHKHIELEFEIIFLGDKTQWKY